MRPAVRNEGTYDRLCLGVPSHYDIVSTPLVGTGNSLYATSSTGVRVPATGALAIGTGDFTVDGFVRFTDGTIGDGDRPIVSFGSAPQAVINSGKFGIYTSGYTLSTIVPVLGTTYHWELSRASGTLRLFIDGALACSATYAASMVDGPLWVGSNPDASAAVRGLIDEFRVTVGTARHTAAFTPPTTKCGRNTTDDPLFDSVPVLLGFDNDALVTPSVRRLPAVRRASRPGYRSDGHISGTVKIYGSPDVPVRRQVFAIRELDMRGVTFTWSNEITGAYVLTGLDPGYTYTVVSYDAPRAYRAVIADNVTPIV